MVLKIVFLAIGNGMKMESIFTKLELKLAPLCQMNDSNNCHSSVLFHLETFLKMAV